MNIVNVNPNWKKKNINLFDHGRLKLVQEVDWKRMNSESDSWASNRDSCIWCLNKYNNNNKYNNIIVNLSSELILCFCYYKL